MRAWARSRRLRRVRRARAGAQTSHRPCRAAAAVVVGRRAGPAASPLRPEAGHNLAILAAACWFGGYWSDAEGDTEDMRGQATEARCHDVVRRVYGKDDDDRYRQLRAVEPTIVGDIAAKVETLAKEDSDDAPRSQTLAQLVQAVAAADARPCSRAARARA